MRISITGPIPYDDVVNMTTLERNSLVEVLHERIDAANPNKQRQTKMVPGQVNGPQTPQTPKSEQR
jgi:hypothetical protein